MNGINYATFAEREDKRRSIGVDLLRRRDRSAEQVDQAHIKTWAYLRVTRQI